MEVFSNVKIPVFGVESSPAIWTDPTSPASAGFYFGDDDWLKSTNAVRRFGVVEGIARSVDYNTVLRQCSTMSSLFANILAYRNSVARAGGVFPYGGASDAPIGSDLNGESDMSKHIGALSEIFSVDKFLFDNEVTTRTISESAVTTDKLANSSVTNTKISNDSVTRSKLGDDLVMQGTATKDGLSLTISQGTVPGNRGLTVTWNTTKPTTAGLADSATSAIQVDTQSASSANVYLTGATSTTSGTPKTLYTSSAVYISGASQLNAESFNVTSDERLKENIEEIGHNQVKALVENVKVKTFNYIDSPKKTNVGIVAQDIIGVNTVVGDTLVNTKEDGFYSVRESKLVYILWDYIQQLEKRVKELEEK